MCCCDETLFFEQLVYNAINYCMTYLKNRKETSELLLTKYLKIQPHVQLNCVLIHIAGKKNAFLKRIKRGAKRDLVDIQVSKHLLEDALSCAPFHCLWKVKRLYRWRGTVFNDYCLSALSLHLFYLSVLHFYWIIRNKMSKRCTIHKRTYRFAYHICL